MRLAGTIPNEDHARRFYGYLLTLGISSKVEPSESGFVVWVREEEHVNQAVRELEEFLRLPEDPRYAKAFEAAREILREEVAKDKEARKNHIDLRERWSRGSTKSSPVTVVLIAVSILVAVLSRFGEQKDSPAIQDLSIASYQVQPGQVVRLGLSQIQSGQVWRLVTPIFIHFGPVHLLFNMWMLFSMGRIVESRRGSLWLAATVVVVAISSNLAQYEWQQGPTFGGMSGVLYGLFGYLWMKHRFDPAAGIRLNPSFIVAMVGWFFLCMMGVVGPVANMAHSVGMVTGIVIGLAPVAWRRIKR